MAFTRMVSDYSELVHALRDRAIEMQISRLDLDEIGGLTSGHSSKLLSSKPAKIFGPISLGPMLEVLGLRVVLGGGHRPDQGHPVPPHAGRSIKSALRQQKQLEATVENREQRRDSQDRRPSEKRTDIALAFEGDPGQAPRQQMGLTARSSPTLLD